MDLNKLLEIIDKSIEETLEQEKLGYKIWLFSKEV